MARAARAARTFIRASIRAPIRAFVRLSDAAPLWLRLLGYGAVLALGALALQGLDYLRLARTHSPEVITALAAAGFLAMGVFVGLRLSRPAGAAKDAHAAPAAQAALGISDRELEVLREIATGRSNKEVAQRLRVSPNTVKTHAAHLFAKLGARTRTEAVARARELGLTS